MDFEDTADEAAYRRKARAWIAANAPSEKAPTVGREPSASLVQEAKAWQGRKAAAGYAGITKPKEWGGAGGSVMDEIIFNQEEADAGYNFSLFGIGLGMCVPLILALGSDELKDRHIRRAIRGETIWAQLFSEPSAGSDLAGLRTRAERDGDEWVVNGQKIWNSGTAHCDFAILMTRTDPSRAKHEGMTMFWIDLKTPGVDIRPIKQVSGASEFNEVFLSDVRIPDGQRIGEIDGGWKAALVTLMNERAMILGTSRKPSWEEIFALARDIPSDLGGTLIKDDAFRDRLADWIVRAEGLKMTRYRLITAISRGGQPGPEASIGKIISANLLQELGAAGTEALDQFGIIDDPDYAPMDNLFSSAFLYSPGARLGGGTDEIMKNVIAERVLGLPGEIRADKGPFRDIPSGKRG